MLQAQVLQVELLEAEAWKAPETLRARVMVRTEQKIQMAAEQGALQTTVSQEVAVARWWAR